MMAHKILPPDTQLLFERARTAQAVLEALDAKTKLARILAERAQLLWQQGAVAAGVQDGDEVTEDYRVRRKGLFVEEEANESESKK